MIDIGNPLYFCIWLEEYIKDGGKDIELIDKIVKIPIHCKRGMSSDGEWVSSDDMLKDKDSWGKE